MELKASPFLHILKMNEKYSALYNSLTLEVAFVEASFLDEYKKGDLFISTNPETEDVLISLKKIGLLIDKDNDGMELYNTYRKTLDKPAINILYLLLTDACNLRCKYCYFLANMDKHYVFSFMNEETAILAINMFAKNIKDSRALGHNDQQIVIYGGEPTLNRKTLLRVLRYVDEIKESGKLPDSVSITVNTNGVLLDQEILEQCKKSGVVIAISIDGPKEIHDQMRIYPSKQGSFNRVIDSYNATKTIGVKTGICVTIDKHNVQNIEKVTLWLIENLEVKGIGFNILIENEDPQTEKESHQYSELVAAKLIECFKIARERGLYEDRMMRRVKNFVEKTPVFSDCGGCGLQMVVSPDGKIGVCQAFCGSKEYFVKEPLESFEPINHPFWKEWRKRSPLTMEECKACIALGNCGGGCPYNAYKRKGTIWSLDERFCVHAKTAAEFLIRDLWEKQSRKAR